MERIGTSIQKAVAETEAAVARLGVAVMFSGEAAKLEDARTAIDGIDSAMAGLLSRRLALSRFAQRTRAELGSRDLEREDLVLQRWNRIAPGGERVGRAVIDYCLGPDVLV